MADQAADCSICFKNVLHRQRAIFCNTCKHWIHLKCTALTQNDYMALSSCADDWYCSRCFSMVFPYNLFDDEEDFLSSLFNCDNLVLTITVSANNDLKFSIWNKFSLDESIYTDKHIYSQLHVSGDRYYS